MGDQVGSMDIVLYVVEAKIFSCVQAYGSFFDGLSLTEISNGLASHIWSDIDEKGVCLDKISFCKILKKLPYFHKLTLKQH